MNLSSSYEVVVKNSARFVIVPLKSGIYALDRIYKALVSADVNPYTGYCSNYDYIRQQIVQACQSLQHSDQAATSCLRRLDGALETLTRDEGMFERQKCVTNCTLGNLRTEQASSEKLLQESQRALGQAGSHLSSTRETLQREERRKQNARVTATIGLTMLAVPFVGWVAEKLESLPPSAAQLRYVLLHNAIPFVGFGFLDNAIMIAAVSAAALGNLVSDLAGLGLAGYVEALAARLGMQIPDLTPKQADMWQTRLSSHVGKAIGVTIGCILGMFPLLFLSDEDEEETQSAAVTPHSK
ncbi:Transmembrane protein 65 [Bagarius yarrelli]|uniref:Transmembrane protein 65 n=1 Tax=Bagarius yarrelli TaxID=175774 RepID=A0A556UYY3_BAGYA|nr:Transmembrane protein 65 [Bagarius yarrelli]